MKLLRHCYLLALLLFGAGLGSARAQSFAWAKLSRTPNDTVRSNTVNSVTDSNGNTYVHGTYRDSVIVGSSTFRALGTMSSVIVKYDSTGTVLWAKNLNGVVIVSLAADNSAGGFYFTAEQYTNNGPITWDGAPLPLAATPPSPFHAKCSASGALQWAQPLPVNTGQGCTVVADDAGDAYLQSIAYSSTTVGGVPVNANSVYILKINGAGVTQWVQTLHFAPGIGFSFSSSKFGAKPGGGCLLSGCIPAGANLLLGPGSGTSLLTSASINDQLLINFNASGTPLWTIVMGSWSQSASLGALLADAAGNCYITGSAPNGIQLSGVALGPSFFLAKYNASGAMQWARGEQQGTAGNMGYQLAANSRGVNVAVSVQNPVNSPVKLGPLTLRSYFNIVHYSPQGDEQWAASDSRTDYSVSATRFSYYSISSLGLDSRGNLYAAGTPRTQTNRPGPSVNLPVLQLGALTTVGSGLVACRLNAYANTLRGQVYLDQNGNGQQDASEQMFARPLTGILAQGTATSYFPVGADGVLQAYAAPGAYQLSLAPVAHYTISQPSSGSYAGTFSGSNQLISGQHFGLVPVANQADVRVTLTPYGAVRAGFTVRYRVTVENVGTTTVSGTVTATLDSHLSYISSTPSGTRTGQTVSWSYANLAPFGHLDYDVLASLPTNVVLGTALLSTATAPLVGDVDATDNTSTAAQTVVGPFDPNSIEVNYERLTPAQVATRLPLDYTIHFQNLGTAEATAVILSDTLDASKLNLSSLALVAQSHNCSWSLASTGPNAGQLTVRFLGINLPGRNVDVIRSQGFVRFRVQPRTTLAVGEVIPNRAGIVFDFNAPVMTNTATTTVMLASAALANHTAAAWNAYPNPATDAVTVAADLATAGPVRLDLLDALGRSVRRQTFTAPAGPLRQTLDLRDLAPGFYVLRLTPPTGPASSQQLVRE
ncbi:DUF7619 domain-containing protein [Hymenobacter properus]|uniref:T9SS type A sorting domain-containing protein n=1 Tax=Hymenobacter properus TaxID=2791026 RepID=A0A931FNW4_9BACT|nr:T9SS type A sorting domain-containing protein [Hymenobacter properus]MBF9143039.1 T9SS type A sorting domain-containing protein [Hymenobacter properus]MBR7721847.1 T9SS type A sorting domain-containing protein [Microvirga sp. SRT04]